MAADSTQQAPAAAPADRVQRHAAIDRMFHWVTAATMTALLVTGLLPVVGIGFAWLDVHWISGLLLTAAILLHVVRAVTVQGLRAMSLRPRDLGEIGGRRRPGKYSLQQKTIHLGWTVAILVAIGTGIVLMIKAGTPFFERDPYIFTLQTWGVLTVLHDLAALLCVFLVLVHVYFGLLPEKRMYLRSMLRGWVTRAELAENHDPERVARGE
jgi:cytochrome b subunit of formate dehydrogenase